MDLVGDMRLPQTSSGVACGICSGSGDERADSWDTETDLHTSDNDMTHLFASMQYTQYSLYYFYHVNEYQTALKGQKHLWQMSISLTGRDIQAY